MDMKKLFLLAWLAPIIMSGIIELLQAYCTGDRRSGEWLDFAANSIGATIGGAIGILLAKYRARANKGNKQVRIVETAVAYDFHAHKRGLHESLILASQFHFCHQQPFVVAVKLIDFKRVLPLKEQDSGACLSCRRGTKAADVRLIKGYLFLKLVA